MVAELLAGTNAGADRAGRPKARLLLAELHTLPAENWLGVQWQSLPLPGDQIQFENASP